MPYDELEIKDSEEILTAEEIEAAEPEDVAEEVPEELEAIDEEAAEVTEEIDDAEEAVEAEDEDDGLVAVLGALRDAVAKTDSRIIALEGQIAAIIEREAARNKKLSGFFAPVPDGQVSEPGEDPLPRIERKYIY